MCYRPVPWTRPRDDPFYQTFTFKRQDGEDEVEVGLISKFYKTLSRSLVDEGSIWSYEVSIYDAVFYKYIN